MQQTLETLDSSLSKAIEDLETKLIYDDNTLSDENRDFLQDLVNSLEDERFEINNKLEELQ